MQALPGILIVLLGGLSQPLHPIVGLAAAHGLQSLAKRERSNTPLLRLALFVVPLLIMLVGLASIGHLPI